MCGFVKVEPLCKKGKVSITNPVADIAAEEACYFITVLDAMKSYHQYPLDEESQVLTTFITPFGRFKYLRAPYGLSSIAKHYNHQMTEAFEGLSRFRRIVDDIVIFDKDEESHKRLVKQFLQQCNDRRISLNKEKWQYCQDKVDFSYLQKATGWIQQLQKRYPNIPPQQVVQIYAPSVAW